MTVRGNWWTNLGIEKLSTDESRELKCAISSLIGVQRKMILSGQTGMEWDTVSGEAGFPVSMEGKRMDADMCKCELMMETSDLSQAVVQPYANWKCSIEIHISLSLAIECAKRRESSVASTIATLTIMSSRGVCGSPLQAMRD